MRVMYCLVLTEQQSQSLSSLQQQTLIFLSTGLQVGWNCAGLSWELAGYGSKEWVGFRAAPNVSSFSLDQQLYQAGVFHDKSQTRYIQGKAKQTGHWKLLFPSCLLMFHWLKHVIWPATPSIKHGSLSNQGWRHSTGCQPKQGAFWMN